MFTFNQSNGPSPVAAAAGKKRFAASDSSHDNADSVFQSKRIMAGSAFDIHRAEPSHQQPVEPPLDSHRAGLSRQHVRALNSQFASWVQTQLLNHPDELWEDGVQDYIAHASEIKVKFSDVVNWLKANAAKGQSIGPLGSFSEPNRLLSASKDNGTKLLPETPLFSQGGKTAGFLPLWSPGVPKSQNSLSFGSQNATPSNSVVSNDADGGDTKKISFFSGVPKSQNSFSFGTGSQNATISNNGVSNDAGGGQTKNTSLFSGVPNNQNSFSFGSQNATPSNNGVSNDADGEEELEQPSSPSVKKTEEKGIIVVHEVKCKIYVKSSDPADKDTWKDKGTGQLSIKCKEGVNKGTKESKPTILVRNDVGRVSLNALIYPGIKTSLQKNSVVAIFHTAGDGGNDGGDSEVVARTFLIRTKTEEDRNKLAAAIQEYAPSS